MSWQRASCSRDTIYAAMRFTKMHGAGNDYVLLDARQQERDWSALARTLCDVRSDGDRGSSHLRGEPEALRRRETLGHAIHVEYKPMRYLPHTELSVVMHPVPIPLRRPGWNGFVIRNTLYGLRIAD